MSLPSEVTGSRIYSKGGLLSIPGLLAPDAVAALHMEAASARALGRRNVLPVSAAAETRGGDPARAFTTAHGGAVQWTIFSAAALLDTLGRICGLAAIPAGGGSYSYYEEAGDFLALHRDIDTCDLTIITCLKETGAAPGGGSLLVYSDGVNASLTAARLAGRAAATPMWIGRGESVALLGGFVPHEVTGMQAGQERIVSVMCYRIPLNGGPFP